jgi:hypothetical protein
MNIKSFLTPEEKEILLTALFDRYGINSAPVRAIATKVRDLPEHELFCTWSQQDVIDAINSDTNSDTSLQREQLCNDTPFLTEVLEHFSNQGDRDSGWSLEELYYSLEAALTNRGIELNLTTKDFKSDE